MFGSIDGFNQQKSDFTAQGFYGLGYFLSNRFSFHQQFQPIISFMAFFKGYLKFADEISPAVTVLRFSYVCADAASGTQDLVFDMSPVVNIITHFDNQNGKLQAQFCQCAFHVDMIAFFIEFSRIYHTRYRS